jgi:taurine dioxygenase
MGRSDDRREELTMTVNVRPIDDDLSFGARVSGVTPEALGDPEVRDRLNEAFEARGLLIFEGVDPTPQMQVAISTVFGPLKDHPSQATPRVGGDDLLGVIEIRHEPNEGGVVELDGRRLSQWLPWHFDHCYNDQLNRAGVLRAVAIPPDGGRTGFVDGIALYEAVSPDVRDRIEGEKVIYAMDVILENLRFGRPEGFVEVQASPQTADVMAEYATRPRAIHPAVWTRDSGEKVLHVSPWMAKGLEGRDQADADRLLTEICDEIVEAARGLCYFHRWDPADMVIWDNWRILHSVSGSAPEHGRCMHRTTIAGDYGLGRFEEPAATA